MGCCLYTVAIKSFLYLFVLEPPGFPASFGNYPLFFICLCALVFCSLGLAPVVWSAFENGSGSPLVYSSLLDVACGLLRVHRYAHFRFKIDMNRTSDVN